VYKIINRLAYILKKEFHLCNLISINENYNFYFEDDMFNHTNIQIIEQNLIIQRVNFDNGCCIGAGTLFLNAKTKGNNVFCMLKNERKLDKAI